jgi:outer membrane protein assembly factor BamA
VGLALWRFTPTGGGAPFTRAMLDLRVFRPLGSASHVAAARVLAAADSGADEGPTPFHLQNWLGGSHSLRGFGSYRFRGEALAHVSVEYRWRAFSRLDVVAFVDAGTVAGAVSRLALSDVHATPGVGIRVRTDARLLSRVDWAHGSAGHRVLWSLSPSF